MGNKGSRNGQLVRSLSSGDVRGGLTAKSPTPNGNANNNPYALPIKRRGHSRHGSLIGVGGGDSSGGTSEGEYSAALSSSMRLRLDRKQEKQEKKRQRKQQKKANKKRGGSMIGSRSAPGLSPRSPRGGNRNILATPRTPRTAAEYRKSRTLGQSAGSKKLNFGGLSSKKGPNVEEMFMARTFESKRVPTPGYSAACSQQGYTNNHPSYNNCHETLDTSSATTTRQEPKAFLSASARDLGTWRKQIVEAGGKKEEGEGEREGDGEEEPQEANAWDEEGEGARPVEGPESGAEDFHHHCHFYQQNPISEEQEHMAAMNATNNARYLTVYNDPQQAMSITF
ncbi:hypothetical protein QOT17_016708 [Balamuthia mandrillaris]